MRASPHALTLCLALLGCRDAPPATSSPAPPVEESIIADAGSDAPIVSVLDAGREPRRALEQAPIPGERDVELAMDMSALGHPSSAPATMHVTVRWSTSAATDVPWRFTVQRAEMKMAGAAASGAEQAIVDALTTMYAQIVGHAQRRGPAQLEIVQTHGMPTQPSVPWLLHLFAFAPPREPLGVGASWTTESNTDVDGELCTDSRRYEITSIDAQGITALLTVALHCGPAAGATEPSPTMRYAMNGELRLVATDALAIAGDLTCTLTTKFPQFADDPDAPQELEAKLRFRLATTSE